MMNKLFIYAARLRNNGVHIARWALVIVFLWIGGLNAAIHKPYGAVPYRGYYPKVSSHSQDDAPKYNQYPNSVDDHKPGKMSGDLSWNIDTFSHGLGALFIIIGVMIMLFPLWPGVSAAGSFLAIVVSLFTLVLLGATPGNWTTPGDDEQGFPHLTTAGSHVASGIIILGASIATMIDAAKKHLKKKQKVNYLA